MSGFQWLFVFLSILAIVYVFSHTPEKKLLNYYFGAALLLILFVAQDVSVGPDVSVYCYEYSLIRDDYSWLELLNHRWELGYVFLNKIITLFFYEKRALLLVLSMIILFPIFGWLRKMSPQPVLSILCFVALGYYGTALGVFRQWCAIAILVLSFRYIQERRFVPFLILLLLATSFHRTAIVFLSVYFVYGFPIKAKYLWGFGVCSALLGVLGRPIMMFLNQFARVPEIGGFNGGITMFVVLWVFVILGWLFLQDVLNEPHYKLMFVMLLLAATVQPIAFTFSNWSRVVRYFHVSLIVIIPQLYQAVCIKKENNIVLSVCRSINSKLCCKIERSYGKPGWVLATHCLIIVVLFVWMFLANDGIHYVFAPM